MIHVFIGPTLSRAEAETVLDAVYLPPVSQGDVYRSSLDQPWAIAIVDGYFERVPSVWHKEILWALTQGIHVFGASSMGALRAAELETFGMVGIGRIFEAYRDGRLEDDDEVAVIHDSAFESFRCHSESMVNIRATLERAQEERVITDEARSRLERIAKSLHYSQREYETVLRIAEQDGMATASIGRFERWLREGRVNRKRDDALELLHLLARDLATKPEPKRVTFTFQRTEIWEHALSRCGRESMTGQATAALPELVLDEIRLLGREAYRTRRDAALGRALALEEARRQDATVSQEALQEEVVSYRQRHGLLEPQRTQGWMSEQRLDEESLAARLADVAKIQSIHGAFARETDRQLAAELRLSGEYRRLSDRVRDKEQLLGEAGVSAVDLESSGIEQEALLAWYFEERLKQPAPADLELYARDLDLQGSDVLLRILLREYLLTRKGDVLQASQLEGTRMHEQ